MEKGYFIKHHRGKITTISWLIFSILDLSLEAIRQTELVIIPECKHLEKSLIVGKKTMCLLNGILYNIKDTYKNRYEKIRYLKQIFFEYQVIIYFHSLWIWYVNCCSCLIHACLNAFRCLIVFHMWRYHVSNDISWSNLVKYYHDKTFFCIYIYVKMQNVDRP